MRLTGQAESSSSSLDVGNERNRTGAAIVSPALTTVRQPLAKMGRTAVSLLIRLLERQRFETLHVELATRLVIRDSTAPPRAV